MICQYCNNPAKWVPNEQIYGIRFGKSYMAWWCENCDAYVGCHKNTKKPLGTLGNSETRDARRKAHFEFDRLWKNRKYPRRKAYDSLSRAFGKQMHIGESDSETCKKIIEWAIEERKKRGIN